MGLQVFYKKNLEIAFLMKSPKVLVGVSSASIDSVVEKEIANCPPDPRFGFPDDDFRWYLGAFRWQFLIDSARAYRDKFDLCQQKYAVKESRLFQELNGLGNPKFKVTNVDKSPFNNVCLLLLEICEHTNPKFSFAIDLIGDDMSDANYAIYANEKTLFSTKQRLRGVVRLSEITSISSDNGSDFIVETKTGYVSLNLFE